MNRRKSLTRILTASLFLAAFLTIGGCSGFLTGVDGRGAIVTEARDADTGIRRVELRGKGNLYLSQGEPASLQLEAQRNILDILETRISDGVLVIEPKKRLGKTKGIDVHLTVPRLTSVRVSGAGDISGETLWSVQDLELIIQGAGDIDMEVRTGVLETVISGAGSAELKGFAERHRCRISGSGDLQALSLETRESDVRISGAGSGEIWVKERLNARISGAGSIRYRGNPAELTKDISGAGSVVPLD